MSLVFLIKFVSMKGNIVVVVVEVVVVVVVVVVVNNEFLSGGLIGKVLKNDIATWQVISMKRVKMFVIL